MVRTKKYITGDYVEIEVFNVSPRKKTIGRARRQKESSPAQKNLNDKRAKRYFVRLVNSNFGKGDFTAELTYDNDHLPDSRERILMDVKNYVRSLRKVSLDPAEFKYIYVISNHKGDGSGSKARPHVHMFISGVKRDDIEDKWHKGYANADRIQLNEYGVTGKAIYMVNQSSKVGRSWGGSKYLRKPEAIVSDKAVSRSQMEYMRRSPDDSHYFEKLINKNNKTRYTFTDCIVEYDGRDVMSPDDTGVGNGFSLLIRMRKELPDRMTTGREAIRNESRKYSQRRRR